MTDKSNPDFSLNAKRLIVKTVQTVLGAPQAEVTSSAGSHFASSPVCLQARLAAQDGTDKGKYSWYQVRRKDDGTWDDVTGGYKGTLASGSDKELSPAFDPKADHSHGRDRSGERVSLVKGTYKNASGKVALCWYVAQTDGPIYVKLTSDGGSAGNQTTAATWTYMVQSQDSSITYATTKSPKHQRRAAGKTTAATIGIIFWNETTGAWDLVWTDEVAGSASCS